MTKRMLIDATHAEETRVVVLDGNRLEDFDVETSTKQQLKGNIYLAKVVRVEPSLQAAFVEYGGGRHGFLAFGEIHPDYYQIPVADRQRLLEMQAEDARREEEEEDRAAAAEEAGETISANVREIEISYAQPETIEHGAIEAALPNEAEAEAPDDEPHTRAQPASIDHETVSDTVEALTVVSNGPQPEFMFSAPPAEPAPELSADVTADLADAPVEVDFGEALPADTAPSPAEPDEPTHSLGGESFSDEPEQTRESGDDREQRIPPRFLRNYKIQEVIKRRQILLIQVVKEERGTKGAALTTYISLAGRFCVLMPNSPRGGGISRKITSAADRRRLKEITTELAVPKGMGLIVRTAGAQRPKPEIKRDCEYLMRLWDDIREHTMRSVAPALIYEEASLIKRAIRDVYSRDCDEILVDGEQGWRAARDFMRMLMPSHAKKVQLWRDPNGQPLFARHQVDAQLDAMMSPTVQLKSGGYLVINQAEALVAVDVNSGRSTRERGIEETALRTNLEAADEVARQLRLRDLAGLVVIDFIDMEAKKHNAMVERRLKEALKNDRARIQVGQISHFGLLEMSRQRLRPSLAETSFVTCSHCGGLGHVRSTESAAIQVLRAIEEEGAKRRSAEIVVNAATSIAMYVLNHKRERLQGIEARYGMHVVFASDETLNPPNIRIERIRAQLPGEGPAMITQDSWQNPSPAPEMEPEIEEDDVVETVEAVDERTDEPTEAQAQAQGQAPTTETPEEAERSRRKRRRRRRGGRREDGTIDTGATTDGEVSADNADGENADGAITELLEAGAMGETVTEPPASPEGLETEVAAGTEDEEAQRRRRGRRGGRRRRRDEETPESISAPGAEQPDLPSAFDAAAPATPFGGRGYDIFDAPAAETPEAAHEGPAIVAVEPAPAVTATRPSGESFSEPEEVEPTAQDVSVSQVVVVPISLTPPVDAVPEPVLPEPVLPEPVLPEPVQPEPVQPEPVVELSALEIPKPPPAPEPELVAEPVSGPLVQPILIDDSAAPVEKKRGWWRR